MGFSADTTLIIDDFGSVSATLYRPVNSYDSAGMATWTSTTIGAFRAQLQEDPKVNRGGDYRRVQQGEVATRSATIYASAGVSASPGDRILDGATGYNWQVRSIKHWTGHIEIKADWASPRRD